MYLLVEKEGLVLDDPELSPEVDLTILAILELVLDSSLTNLSKSLWSNLSWTCLSVLVPLSLFAAFKAGQVLLHPSLTCLLDSEVSLSEQLKSIPLKSKF